MLHDSGNSISGNVHGDKMKCNIISHLAKFMGANMGPTWVLSAQGGPHVGPINLAIRAVLKFMINSITYCLYFSIIYTLLQNALICFQKHATVLKLPVSKHEKSSWWGICLTDTLSLAMKYSYPPAQWNGGGGVVLVLVHSDPWNKHMIFFSFFIVIISLFWSFLWFSYL